MLKDQREGYRITWSGQKLLVMVLVGTVIATLLGASVWLILAGMSNWSEVGTAVIFGAVFGGWVGLGACLLFGLVRRMREYGLRSPLRMALTLALFGGIAASPLFVPFADGWGMAIGGLVEAAIGGGLIGGVLGILLFLIMFRRATSHVPT